MKKNTFSDRETLEKIKSFAGKECVYRERELYIHARLEKTDIQEWGLWIHLRDLRSPGFTGELRSNPESEAWTVAASWEVFSFSTEIWGAAYAGWTLFFDPFILKGMCRYAATLVQPDAKIRYKSLMNCLHHLRYKKSFLYIKPK